MENIKIAYLFLLRRAFSRRIAQKGVRCAGAWCAASRTVVLLAEIPRDIVIFNHVFDLTLCGDDDENDEVNHQNRTEHRDGKNREERADEGNQHSFG